VHMAVSHSTPHMHLLAHWCSAIYASHREDCRQGTQDVFVHYHGKRLKEKGVECECSSNIPPQPQSHSEAGASPPVQLAAKSSTRLQNALGYRFVSSGHKFCKPYPMPPTFTVAMLDSSLIKLALTRKLALGIYRL
jgi:hypothetical protein